MRSNRILLVFVLITSLCFIQVSTASAADMISGTTWHKGLVMHQGTPYTVTWSSTLRLDYNMNGTLRQLYKHADGGCIYASPGVPFGQAVTWAQMKHTNNGVSTTFSLPTYQDGWCDPNYKPWGWFRNNYTVNVSGGSTFKTESTSNWASGQTVPASIAKTHTRTWW